MMRIAVLVLCLAALSAASPSNSLARRYTLRTLLRALKPEMQSRSNEMQRKAEQSLAALSAASSTDSLASRYTLRTLLRALEMQSQSNEMQRKAEVKKNFMGHAGGNVGEVTASGGDHVVEGDMKVPPGEQWTEWKANHGGANRRKLVQYDSFRWPDNVIPWRYGASMGESFTNARNAIQQGMAEWERLTCLKFREMATGETDGVEFIRGGGCWSYVGKVSKYFETRMQGVSIDRGCESMDTAAHEIGHALGFHHEQSRPDRDQYVKINWDNIMKDMEYNFNKESESLMMDVPYDYMSIMHYGKTYFSKNGEDTVVTTDPAYQNRIGNTDGLSFYDVMLANKFMACDEGCPGEAPCGADSYRGKDCKCYCKGSDSTSIVECNPVVVTTPAPTTPAPTTPAPTTPAPTTPAPTTPAPTTPAPTTQNPSCSNLLRDTTCQDLAGLDWCDHKKGFIRKFMKKQCEKSCGRCP